MTIKVPNGYEVLIVIPECHSSALPEHPQLDYLARLLSNVENTSYSSHYRQYNRDAHNAVP